MIRVILPYHLRSLARVQSEVILDIPGPSITVKSVLDALELRYPMLAGTMRDHDTKKRRPFIRFFACCEDFSAAEDTPLPEKVLKGEEPFLVVGAVAGG